MQKLSSDEQTNTEISPQSNRQQVPGKNLLILATQNGNVVVTNGAPKMNHIRKMGVGSEITAMEYISNKEFRISLRDGQPTPLIAFAFRTISSISGDAKSRIRVWSFRDNEIMWSASG